MSYQEKRIVASVVTGFFVLVSYCVYATSKYLALGNPLLHNLKFWATSMLFTIAVGIVIMILVQVLLHVVLAISTEVKKELSKQTACVKILEPCEECEISNLEDEMDKLIELKASKCSYGLLGLGFVASLLSLYFQQAPGIMLNIIFLSFLLASLLEGYLQLNFYKKGIHHG